MHSRKWCPLIHAISTPLLVQRNAAVQYGRKMGEHAFTLADEAAGAIALIDEPEGKVHLAGHSYGRGLALHLARPVRVANLAFYEASALRLLRQMSEAATRLWQRSPASHSTSPAASSLGDYRGAMAIFIVRGTG